MYFRLRQKRKLIGVFLMNRQNASNFSLRLFFLNLFVFCDIVGERDCEEEGYGKGDGDGEGDVERRRQR
jgi:hypothetical protein